MSRKKYSRDVIFLLEDFHANLLFMEKNNFLNVVLFIFEKFLA